MKQKSLLSTSLAFVFSVLGLGSNAAAVLKGDVGIATIAALIYVLPLFVDAVEDLSTLYILTFTQHRILIISMYVGIIYLLLILGYWALQIGEIVVGVGDGLLRGVLAALPTVFTVSKLYDLRVALKQNENVAKAYCKEL